MTISTEIVLVRHAETTMISDNRIHGQIDAPLTELGITAAKKTAENFRGQKLEPFYASSGRHENSGIYRQPINMKPVPVDGLRGITAGWKVSVCVLNLTSQVLPYAPN
jgi:hypothetical protein